MIRGLDLRLLIPAGCAWAAAAAALGQATSVVAIGVATLVAVAVLAAVTAWRSRSAVVVSRSVALGLCCVATALVMSAVLGHRLVAQAGPVQRLAADRATVTLEATVVSDPRLIASNRLHGQQLTVTRLLVHRVTGRGQVARVRTPVVIFGSQDWLTVRWHERVRVRARLAPADAGADVVAVGSAKGNPAVLARAGPVERIAERLRADLRAATEALPSDPRGLLPALVIGDTGRLPAQLNDDMRATGMTHLNAVSGSNVVFVLMAARWVAVRIRVPGRARVPWALGVLAAFVVLCRPEPSVIRAAAMGVVGLLGTSTARRPAGPPALATAIVALLLIDPHLARSLGFALSALATAGLLFFARSWGDWVARFLPKRARPLADAIAIPVAAQAMCAPVIVLVQPQVSLVGIPANVAAAPFVGPATLMGVLTVLIAPLNHPLASVVAWGGGLPAWGIAIVAHVSAAVPFGALPWPGGASGALALAGLILVLLWCGPPLLHRAMARPRWSAAGLVIVVAAAWPLPGGSRGWPPAGWAMVACDVGQGDALVLSTTPGHAVLIDAGPDPAPVARCLDALGVRAVDAVVLTHYHADHVGGLSGVFAGRQVHEVFVSPVTDGSDAIGRGDAAGQRPLVERETRSHGTPVHPLRQGDTLRWEGVEATVVWPARTIHTGSVQNNGSIVLDLRTHGLRILFTGDIEREAAAAVLGELRRLPAGPPFDVLKVAHHGSANQSPELLAWVHAPVAVISVGAGNDYGHPAAKTLNLLSGNRSAVFRTDRGGPVAVVRRAGMPWVVRP